MSTIQERSAERVETILSAYRELAGEGLSDEEAMADLVTDLMHAADVTEADDFGGDMIGAEALIDRAQFHYDMEQGD